MSRWVGLLLPMRERSLGAESVRRSLFIHFGEWREESPGSTGQGAR